MGTSGDIVRLKYYQLAKDGYWDEFNWEPPKGVFPDGMIVPPVHLDATDKVTQQNQHLEFNYFMRVNQIQKKMGGDILTMFMFFRTVIKLIFLI